MVCNLLLIWKAFLIMNKLILIRGLPGSGKSTFAKSMMNTKINWQHLETDMFWGPDYDFDVSRLREAHEWCQRQTRSYLFHNHNLIVSNTFTTKKELQPYFDIAKEFDIVPQVILCQNEWKNVHNVPEEVLERMKNRFEYNIGDLWTK